MGRKPVFNQKYTNYGRMDTYRTTVPCKYYEGNNRDFITCNHLVLSRDDYDLDYDCTEHCTNCPQYQYLEWYYKEQDKKEIAGILKQLEDEVRSGRE